MSVSTVIVTVNIVYSSAVTQILPTTGAQGVFAHSVQSAQHMSLSYIIFKSFEHLKLSTKVFTPKSADFFLKARLETSARQK